MAAPPATSSRSIGSGSVCGRVTTRGPASGTLRTGEPVAALRGGPLGPLGGPLSAFGAVSPAAGAMSVEAGAAWAAGHGLHGCRLGRAAFFAFVAAGASTVLVADTSSVALAAAFFVAAAFFTAVPFPAACSAEAATSSTAPAAVAATSRRRSPRGPRHPGRRPHRELGGELVGELAEQLVADVGHHPAAELGRSAGDVEVGQHVDPRDGALGGQLRGDDGRGGAVAAGPCRGRR